MRAFSACLLLQPFLFRLAGIFAKLPQPLWVGNSAAAVSRREFRSPVVAKAPPALHAWPCKREAPVDLASEGHELSKDAHCVFSPNFNE